MLHRCFVKVYEVTQVLLADRYMENNGDFLSFVPKKSEWMIKYKYTCSYVMKKGDVLPGNYCIVFFWINENFTCSSHYWWQMLTTLKCKTWKHYQKLLSAFLIRSKPSNASRSGPSVSPKKGISSLMTNEAGHGVSIADEDAIMSHMDSFCNRIRQLIDVINTLAQFNK